MRSRLSWLPNAITLVRVCLVIPLVILLAQRAYEAALVVLFLGAVSDLVDGVLARWLRCQSNLGCTLDAAADRLLILAGFAVLAIQGHAPDALFGLLLARDLLILMAMLVFQSRSGTLPAVTFGLGRVSTFLQFLFLFVALLQLVQTAVTLPGAVKPILVALVVIATLASGFAHAWRLRQMRHAGSSAT